MLSVRFSRAPQRHIAPRASGIFWRSRLRFTNANGVCSRWVQCEDFLYTNVMLPVVAEIIHVFEPFLRLEAKVRESDLIGIIGEADATVYYAVQRCGGIAVPINVLYKAEEIAYILQDSEAKALILYAGFAAQGIAGEKKLSSVPSVIVIGDPAPEGMIPWETLTDGSSPERVIGRSGSPVGLPLPRRIFQGRNSGRQRPRRDPSTTTQNIAPPSHAF
jgi:hypothetical protein